MKTIELLTDRERIVIREFAVDKSIPHWLRSSLQDLIRRKEGKGLMNDFEKWVTRNCPVEEHTDKPPQNWDRQNEFFYMVGDRQYRVPIAKVPARFSAVIMMARATGSH